MRMHTHYLPRLDLFIKGDLSIHGSVVPGGVGVMEVVRPN